MREPDPAVATSASSAAPSFGLAWVAAAAGLALATVAISKGNLAAATLSSALSAGLRHSQADPNLAAQDSARARNMPYFYDPAQTSSRLNAIATSLTNNPRVPSADFVRTQLAQAIDFQTHVVSLTPHHAGMWLELANLYWTWHAAMGTAPTATAMNAVQRAVMLTPRHPKPLQLKARMQLQARDIEGAKKSLTEALAYVPDNLPVIMQLAVIHSYSGAAEQGVRLAEGALKKGYRPTSAGEVSWMGAWYAQHANWADAQRIFNLAVKADPTSIDDYVDLARVYMAMGQRQQAIAVAQTVASRAPGRRTQVDAIIGAVAQN